MVPSHTILAPLTTPAPEDLDVQVALEPVTAQPGNTPPICASAMDLRPPSTCPWNRPGNAGSASARIDPLAAGNFGTMLSRMPLVRILVDGYSLLHRWPELAPGRPRHSAAAREALIARLRQYRDASHTPITIVFDGQGAPPGTTRPVSTAEFEILYSQAGRTADDLIERAAVRLKAYGDVLVITDDLAERDTVSASGGWVSSCRVFIEQVEDLLKESGEDLQRWNRRERERFRRGRP